MTKVELRRPGEKLNEARRALMGPYPKNELFAFAEAIDLVRRALERLDRGAIRDIGALDWISTLEALSSDDAAEDHAGDPCLERARNLSVDEKRDFADAVDELANWLAREQWSRVA